MKIDVLLCATNPSSQKYLTFFATLSSWHKKVDKIIIVDGGTNDGSFDKISQEILGKIDFVSNPKTKWSIFDGFSPNHINTMINEGIKKCKADWLFIIHPDFVLNSFSRGKIEEELSKNRDELWVRFKRFKLKSFRKEDWIEQRDDRGSVVLNMNKIRKTYHFPYVMGLLEDNNIIYDYPIEPTSFARIKFNDSGEVVIPKGTLMNGGKVTLKHMDVFVADHFFYDRNLAEKQRAFFFEYFNARNLGGAKLSKKEIDQKIGKTNELIDLNELIKQPFPKHFKKLMKENYNETILGSKRDDKGDFSIFSNYFYKIKRKLQTWRLRFSKLKATKNCLDWKQNYQDSTIIDLAEVYEDQKKYYN